MDFYSVLKKYSEMDFEKIISNTDTDEIKNIISKETLNPVEFLRLLSPAADSMLEEMAVKAQKLTIQHFGKSVNIYTPMYISNYCVNNCSYCGFSIKNKIDRKLLTAEQIDLEARKISEKGFKHILLLTGESRVATPVGYIKNAILILKKYFSSIGIEIYPLDTEEYQTLIDAGVDSLTIYQETYDESLYDEVHISGPKKDFSYRLLAPERACDAGIYSLGLGALLGLNKNWVKDAFFTGLHAHYIQRMYPEVNLSVSMPRIRPETGGYVPNSIIEDRDLVKYILAIKLFLPRVSVTISTRESEQLRNNLIPLGVNRISAESCTSVGSDDTEDTAQFEISDGRTLNETISFLTSIGYRPVMQDWNLGDYYESI